MATCVKNIAKEVVGDTKRSMLENKETCWWDEIQRVVASKINKFKLWQKIREREYWIVYKNVCEIVMGMKKKQ
jgi:hypothetical protein